MNLEDWILCQDLGTNKIQVKFSGRLEGPRKKNFETSLLIVRPLTWLYVKYSLTTIFMIYHVTEREQLRIYTAEPKLIERWKPLSLNQQTANGRYKSR